MLNDLSDRERSEYKAPDFIPSKGFTLSIELLDMEDEVKSLSRRMVRYRESVSCFPAIKQNVTLNKISLLVALLLLIVCYCVMKLEIVEVWAVQLIVAAIMIAGSVLFIYDMLKISLLGAIKYCRVFLSLPDIEKRFVHAKEHRCLDSDLDDFNPMVLYRYIELKYHDSKRWGLMLTKWFGGRFSMGFAFLISGYFLFARQEGWLNLDNFWPILPISVLLGAGLGITAVLFDESDHILINKLRGRGFKLPWDDE